MTESRSEKHHPLMPESAAAARRIWSLLVPLPSIDADICGLGKKDMELVGTPCQVGSTQWLRLNKQKSTAALLVAGTSEAWVLIDGTQLGVSVLLRRMKEYERMTRAQIADLVAKCKPGMVDQQHESGNIWAVVGGSGKGGIMVRREQDLTSNPFPTKLAPGSLIEELEVEGNRLHYKRLKGDGPDFGWVTIEHNGKHLVEPWIDDNNEDDLRRAGIQTAFTLVKKFEV